MATIPDPVSIQRVIPDGQAPVAQQRDTGMVANAMGQATTQITNAAIEFQQRRINHQYNSAKLKSQVGLYELANSFDQDEDYETMVDRYDEAARQIVGEHSNTISGARERAAYLQEQELVLAQGREAIKDKAWGVETDFKRAELTEYMTKARELVINGQGIQTIENVSAMIDSMKEANYLSEEAGVKALETFKQDSSIAWIESLPPDARIDALKDPVAKNLPSDTRATLMREAEKAALAQNAADMVDRYFNEGMDRTDMIIESGKIKDIKLREEVERRYNNQLADVKAANNQTRSDLWDTYAPQILRGELTVDEMNADSIMRTDMDRMGADLQIRLFALEGQANGRGRTTSDRTVVDKLHQLNQQLQSGRGDPSALRQFFIDNGHLLTPSDFNTWSKVSNEGVVPDEYKALFGTGMPSLNTALRSAGYKGDELYEAQGALTKKLETWNRDYYRENGKSPRDDEIQKKIDQMMLQVTNPGWLWDSNNPMFELSDDDMVDRVSELRGRHGDEILDELTKYVPNPTLEQILEAYTIATE